MSLALATLVVAAIALIGHYFYSTYTYWKRLGIPHETPLPGYGNFKGIGKTLHFRDISRRIYMRFRQETPIAGMYMFFSKTALILDLDLVKSILIKDFGNFHDRGVFNNVKDDPLTGHLVSLEGEQWRSMRQKLTPVFTSGKMKYMFPTVAAVSRNLVAACDEWARSGEHAGVVEFKELCARFTTDVIGTCAFGIDCNCLSDENAEFRRYGRAIFDKPRHNPVVQSFMFTNPAIARRIHLKFFADDVSGFFMNAVRSTVEYRTQNAVRRNDFMDLLIEMMAKDQEAARQGGGVDLSMGLTLEQMAAQTFVFYLAGFDTSSTAMSFCLYELALNPDIQEKVRSEISQVLAEHDGEVTYEAVMAMGYLEQVLSETLRKYTVIPNIIRKAIADYRVPNSSYVIPAGCSIVIPADAIHHDPELYPDPEKFDPDRFEEDVAKERHPCAYLPFGDGPRICIGMRFGRMQAKVGIIHLLREFRITTCPQTEIPVTLSKKSFLTTAENGVYLRTERL